MSILHRKVSPKPDGPDASLIQPTNWNDDHKWDLPVSLGAYTVLTNVGAAYDTGNPPRGLGRVENNWTGVTEIRLSVWCIHVGSGALTWQLWNETDAVAIGTVADSFNASWHTCSGVFTSNLPTGIKVLRLRVLSSVSTADPVYGGSTLLVRRTT